MNKLFLTALSLAVICMFCMTGCPELELEIEEISEYIVTFNLCGGNIYGDLSFVRIPVYEALSIEYLPIPEKTGFNFDGWFTEENGNGGKFTNETRVYSDLTVYANWIITE